MASDEAEPVSGSRYLDLLKGRRPTINDVARFANVSKKTVSRVINKSPAVKEETRKEILSIMNEIGYAPDPQARGLAFRRSFLIGMIYDNPNPQYVVNMQQGLLAGMRETGFELVVHPCDRSSPTFLADIRDFVERQKLFGVVLTPSVSEDERVPPVLDASGCAYIRIASVALDLPERMIISHDHIGAAFAGRHLAELGHHKIGFIAGRPTFRSSHERRRGLEEGLAEFGLKLDEKYVAQGAYTFESGVECGMKLLSAEDRPTAIFAANDEMATGVLQAARMTGLRVPDDVSVVGFDNFQIAERVWPRLTTIHTPTAEIGRLAVTKLLQGRAGQVSDADVGDKGLPSLVIRDSATPPKA
tara:strand:+ start:32015 stop:33091 length:1077 start_codon:yes stop_codon:yes gene_type:complete